MNRRELLQQGGYAAIGTAILIANPNTSAARNAPKCECDPQGPFGVAFLSRVLMAETGEWKEWIRDRRDGRNPIVFTRRGCCCCEISLHNGAHHPDWTYKVRSLSASEEADFRREYGNSADLLTALSLGSGFVIRGFVLSGRIPGWNLSVQQG